MKYTLKITIPDIFEGTLDEWENVFYTLDRSQGDTHCIGEIMHYCRANDWDVEFEYYREDRC